MADKFYYWKKWKKTVNSLPPKYRQALNHYILALYVKPTESYSISFLKAKKEKMKFPKRGETFWKKMQQTYNEIKQTDKDIREVRSNMKNYFSTQPIKHVNTDHCSDLTVLATFLGCTKEAIVSGIERVPVKKNSPLQPDYKLLLVNEIIDNQINTQKHFLTLPIKQQKALVELALNLSIAYQYDKFGIEDETEMDI